MPQTADVHPMLPALLSISSSLDKQQMWKLFAHTTFLCVRNTLSHRLERIYTNPIYKVCGCDGLCAAYANSTKKKIHLVAICLRHINNHKTKDAACNTLHKVLAHCPFGLLFQTNYDICDVRCVVYSTLYIYIV